ncbi:unnamed protein product [Zymoseptoria tritici ST99CH_3D7]|uniref:Uncharacterized protein n=2 Tax=Zymoseptoria tritici TaxID=1047171 RepID=A0A1X7S477_ZYMT9|nr:unnamed protein product [Zymoseptoria tritici ST99CH_3D7]SMR58871.1 unnamed protein product [Zymoseptoria tritici ST99CH_1E4]
MSGDRLTGIIQGRYREAEDVDCFLSWSELPAVVQRRATESAVDCAAKSGEWLEAVNKSKYCMESWRKGQGSPTAIVDGDWAACRTCTNTKKVCFRMVDFVPFALPPPRSVRTSIDSAEEIFWIKEGDRPPPSKIWR